MHRLRRMLSNHLLNGLQFNQQAVIDNQIRPKYPNHHPAKANWNGDLGLHSQARLRQSKSHSLPINRL